MASSSSMDDEAFSERVKKTFGSLFTSLNPSPSSLSDPLWSVTGAEVEKKEWRRDKDTSARDSTPCSSSFDDFLSHARKNSRKNLKNYRRELQDDLRDLDDGGDEEEEEEEEEEEDGGLRDWDVRSSIGLDSTLDNEEEEDTFDKVATGRENAGDRLYMSDVTDNHDSHLRIMDDLPGSVEIGQRDPRANRWAARIRLKEDDAEAATEEQHKSRQPPSRAEKEYTPSTEAGDKLKPILKRKEHETTSKPSKRVRFDPGCIGDDGADKIIREVSDDKTSMETGTQVNGSVLDEKVTRVPDYVRNPSKYTRYSLESTNEMNDKSNTGAYMDFLDMVKKAKDGGSRSEQTDSPVDLPKSITFVPKKKSDTSKADGIDSESTQDRGSNRKCSSMQSTLLVGIAAEEGQETEVGDMEVDEPETSAKPDGGTTFRKQGRQYRAKSQVDEPA